MQHFSPDDLDAATRALDAGAILAVPTETVYGLAVKFDHPAAIQRLMTLKHRAYDSGKIFALMLADPAEITRYCIIPDQAMPLVAEHLPGALTIILPQLPSFTNPYYDHYHTIGIRVPDHDYMQRLLRSTGPLIATSANPRGEAPALTSSEVEQRLPDIDAVVDGAAGHQPPSTVIDATGDRLHTLRQGVIIVDN